MAFRVETTVGAILMLCASLATGRGAQNPAAGYEARHRHLHNGVVGRLRIGEDGIAWEEGGKKPARHSQVWKYEDIQQLVLAPESLRIVTYAGQRWELGRDRVYEFDRLPPALAADWYPKFREKLDRRFVAALADKSVAPEWQMPVKLLQRGRTGSQGALVVGADRVVYKTEAVGESRTWRIGDIETISSSDAFDLTITTRERDFRFQLKQMLPEARYNALWRRVNQANGLNLLVAANPQ